MFLALVFIFMCGSVLAESNANVSTMQLSVDLLLGTWKVEKVAINEYMTTVPITVFEPVLGESYSLTVEFKDDGSCVFTTHANGNAEEQVGSYSIDNQTITREGVIYSFSMDDTGLIIQGSATGIAYPDGYELFVRETDVEPTIADSKEEQSSLDSAVDILYPFPTDVEGYTFISFRDSSIPLYDNNTAFYVFKQYCEQAFPDLDLDILKDFIVVYGNDYGVNETFARCVGEGKRSYYFRTFHFYHPLADYDTCIDVLISDGWRCAFITDPPLHMADYLHELETAPVSFDEALTIAKQTYQALFADNNLPVPDEATLSSMLVRGGYNISYNENIKYWSVSFFIPQTPYDYVLDWTRGVFFVFIDAYTGKVFDYEWIQATPQDAFLNILENN